MTSREDEWKFMGRARPLVRNGRTTEEVLGAGVSQEQDPKRRETTKRGWKMRRP